MTNSVSFIHLMSLYFTNYDYVRETSVLYAGEGTRGREPALKTRRNLINSIHTHKFIIIKR